MADESSPPVPLRFETRIDATPDEIFPYLTESNLITQWLFGTAANLDPEPGGDFILTDEQTPVHGHYLVIDPPHRVIFTWGIPGSDELPAGSSTVEITLTPDGDGTIVQLLHRDLPLDQRERHADGWIACLDTLSRVARRMTPN